MLQVQYNRRGSTGGKDWLPLPTYGNPVETYNEAMKLKRAYLREFKRVFGYDSDLQLHIKTI